MHISNFLPQLPLMPVVGLLWRMIDNQQKKNFIKNWRSNYEDVLYSLVASAIKKAGYHLEKAKVSSVIHIKKPYFHMFDPATIDNGAKIILESIRKEAKTTEISLPELDKKLRGLVLENINSRLAYSLAASQYINKQEFLRHVGYAVEQIERAKELGFEQTAKEMENSLKRLNK